MLVSFYSLLRVSGCVELLLEECGSNRSRMVAERWLWLYIRFALRRLGCRIAGQSQSPTPTGKKVQDPGESMWLCGWVWVLSGFRRAGFGRCWGAVFRVSVQGIARPKSQIQGPLSFSRLSLSVRTLLRRLLIHVLAGLMCPNPRAGAIGPPSFE